MAIVLVDAKHYGFQLRYARRMLNMKRRVVAKLLKISVHELHKYEHGIQPIPPELLGVLLQRGLLLSLCRKQS